MTPVLLRDPIIENDKYYGNTLSTEESPEIYQKHHWSAHQPKYRNDTQTFLLELLETLDKLKIEICCLMSLCSPSQDKSVLDQAWPTIDENFMMPLTYQVRNLNLSPMQW